MLIISHPSICGGKERTFLGRKEGLVIQIKKKQNKKIKIKYSPWVCVSCFILHTRLKGFEVNSHELTGLSVKGSYVTGQRREDGTGRREGKQNQNCCNNFIYFFNCTFFFCG